MLDIGRVGSGDSGSNHCTAMILVGFVVPKGPHSKPKRSWSWSLSLAASILTIVPPSSSTSPALQHGLSTISFSRIPPPDTPVAPHQTMSVPPPSVIVAVIVHVLGRVGGSAHALVVIWPQFQMHFLRYQVLPRYPKGLGLCRHRSPSGS